MNPTAAEQAVLAAAHAFSSAMRAEEEARAAYNLSRHMLLMLRDAAERRVTAIAHAALLVAEDAALDARSAMIRAALQLPGEVPESPFDVVGSP